MTASTFDEICSHLETVFFLAGDDRPRSGPLPGMDGRATARVCALVRSLAGLGPGAAPRARLARQ